MGTLIGARSHSDHSPFVELVSKYQRTLVLLGYY